MNLIIVESPTKARTLTRFLDGKGDYQIEATMGHMRDLPKATLGVDVEHDFEPKYIIPKDKQKRVGELKKIAQKADTIILATDPDREGEAIAWHVGEILKLDVGSKKLDKEVRNKKLEKDQISNIKLQNPTSNFQPLISLKRIVFHEITQSAIEDALKNPRDLDLKLVDAQQARRVLDRLVGYKLSPLLWQKLSRRWLSAGRVQSVAVRLIVEREREIEKFEKQEFWTVEGLFNPTGAVALVANENLDPSSEVARTGGNNRNIKIEAGQNFVGAPQRSNDGPNMLRAQLISKEGIKYEKTLSFDLFDGKYTTTSSTISSKETADSIIKDLKDPYIVSAVDKKEIKRHPYAPFTTSTLQQDAGHRLYFSAKKTMQIAQKLYEEGLITYHRTDSVNLSEKFISEARNFIETSYGKAYVPDLVHRYQTKSKVAQEAHEAIRPTTSNLTNLANLTNSELNRDHARLYDLIWKRALASQASEAIFDSTTIYIQTGNGYEFAAQGSVIKFDGFLKIMGTDIEDIILPTVVVGEALELTQALPTQHFTNPPPRYTEASLIKALEEKEIGRPSTYAPTISTIQDRQYVKKEEKKLIPTELGMTVTDFLVHYFPKIIDLPFTAQMENDLDAIANGEKEWRPVIRQFYEPFAKDLDASYETAQQVKMPVTQIDEKCPTCGNPLVIRTGRYGKFIACSTFPKCKYTRTIVEKIDMKCPRDGGDIVIKKSRRGKMFYGCSNYPKCTFAAWKKEDIK